MSDAGFGVVPLELVRTLDGLTLFKGLVEGRYPAPPISKVLGFKVSEVELGRVVFDYAPVYDHYNPLGTVHGGIAAAVRAVPLAVVAVSGAVQRALVLVAHVLGAPSEAA